MKKAIALLLMISVLCVSVFADRRVDPSSFTAEVVFNLDWDDAKGISFGGLTLSELYRHVMDEHTVLNESIGYYYSFKPLAKTPAFTVSAGMDTVLNNISVSVNAGVSVARVNGELKGDSLSAGISARNYEPEYSKPALAWDANLGFTRSLSGDTTKNGVIVGASVEKNELHYGAIGIATLEAGVKGTLRFVDNDLKLDDFNIGVSENGSIGNLTHNLSVNYVYSYDESSAYNGVYTTFGGNISLGGSDAINTKLAMSVTASLHDVDNRFVAQINDVTLIEPINCTTSSDTSGANMSISSIMYKYSAAKLAENGLFTTFNMNSWIKPTENNVKFNGPASVVLRTFFEDGSLKTELNEMLLGVNADITKRKYE